MNMTSGVRIEMISGAETQKELIRWLASILVLIIISALILTISGKETPEFLRAIGYADAGALCAMITIVKTSPRRPNSTI
jgi:hypothetical protein